MARAFLPADVRFVLGKGRHKPPHFSFPVVVGPSLKYRLKIVPESADLSFQRPVNGMRILLVDDSKPMQMANHAALEKAGYEVIIAGDGKQALSRARSERPDLILLDLQFPGVSGMQVLQELKADQTTAEIPVVILSGLSQKNGQRLIAAVRKITWKRASSCPPRKETICPSCCAM